MADHTPQPLMGDLALAADRVAAQDPTAQDATRTGDAATSDTATSDAARPDEAHLLDGRDLRDPRTSSHDDARHDARHDARRDAARRDPSPDAVPGDEDAGAQGRDRDNGGWGDSGLFGGRAGGTGP